MTDLPHRTVTGKHGGKGFELLPDVLNQRADVPTFLRTRRSHLAADIGAPGPDEEQLDRIMQAATRVPDHGKLSPWRFILFRDAGRLAFAGALERRWRETHPGEEDTPVPEAAFYKDVPLIIAVISSPLEHPKIPRWEQRLSAGAACLNLLNAALAMGFAAQWRSGWPACDEKVAELLRLKEQERIAGFIFIGTRKPDAPELSDRRRPFWRDLTSEFPGGEDAR